MTQPIQAFGHRPTHCNWDEDCPDWLNRGIRKSPKWIYIEVKKLQVIYIHVYIYTYIYIWFYYACLEWSKNKSHMHNIGMNQNRLYQLCWCSHGIHGYIPGFWPIIWPMFGVHIISRVPPLLHANASFSNGGHNRPMLHGFHFRWMYSHVFCNAKKSTW